MDGCRRRRSDSRCMHSPRSVRDADDDDGRTETRRTEEDEEDALRGNLRTDTRAKSDSLDSQLLSSPLFSSALFLPGGSERCPCGVWRNERHRLNGGGAGGAAQMNSEVNELRRTQQYLDDDDDDAAQVPRRPRYLEPVHLTKYGERRTEQKSCSPSRQEKLTIPVSPQ